MPLPDSHDFAHSRLLQTHVIPSEENIDPDVFRHMNSLGCFKDKEKLIRALLNVQCVAIILAIIIARRTNTMRKLQPQYGEDGLFSTA